MKYSKKQLKTWNDKLEEVNITVDIPRLPKNDFNNFNKIIGEPKHPATLERSPLLPHQFDYHDQWFKWHRLLFNKSRKIGATDGGLRNICEGCYGPYIGHNVMIVAGNRQSQANEFLDRFDLLFEDPWKDLDGKIWRYHDLVEDKSSSEMKLYSGVRIKTYPALANAVRGPENVKCCFVSEAAHINRLDDGKVYTALHPIAANDDTMDMIFETTPNGKRGFFYKLWMGALAAQEHNKPYEWHTMEYDYTCALGKLLTEEFIESEKRNPEIDFEQEYCCKFTTSGSSAFKEDEVIYDKNSDLDYFEEF